MIERLPHDFCTIICGQKSYSYRREAATGSIVCYIRPDRCTIFRSAIFPTFFFNIEGDHGLRRRCLQFIWAPYDFLFWLSSMF